MRAEPRHRRPGEAATHYGSFDDLFIVQIHHKEFLCGTGCNMTYMDYEVDCFDNVIVTLGHYCGLMIFSSNLIMTELWTSMMFIGASLESQ
uniref:Uncharacterized protein n=1 Tax=Triticum urartu TaxID=4572 RepID=A0A8R7PDP0_TRIUA